MTDIEIVEKSVGLLIRGSDSFLVTIVHRMRYSRSIHVDVSVVHWLGHWIYNQSIRCVSVPSILKHLCAKQVRS